MREKEINVIYIFFLSRVHLRTRWLKKRKPIGFFTSTLIILVKIEIARDRNKKNRLVAQLRLFFESLPLMVKAAAENNKIFFPTTYLCMYVCMYICGPCCKKHGPKKLVNRRSCVRALLNIKIEKFALPVLSRFYSIMYIHKNKLNPRR
jgi:hypothetical protein